MKIKIIVWSEVNITVKQIHEYLYEQLSDPSVPMKIQEKNILYVLKYFLL